jgi:hypothetical protein
MDVQELANLCVEEINKMGDDSLHDGRITLIIPEQEREVNAPYLSGPNSPQGRLLGTSKEGWQVSFDAIALLAWCVVMGAKLDVRVRH